MANVGDFDDILSRLTPGQLDLLLEMAVCMSREIEQDVNRDSDLLSPEFTANFSNRLIIHHATHDEKFKKKSFEFAFRAASISAGRFAEIVSDPTNPGADVIVDGTRFSLKTEAAANTRQDRIVISKLMEARWIRDCTNQEDFAEKTRSRVAAHLEEYDRILTLRAFSLRTSQVRYDLVEIPRELLLNMKDLTASDFRPKTPGGGSGADVYVDGTKAFNVRMDGSVEKVTISGLLTELCVTHGSWTVPVLGSGSGE